MGKINKETFDKLRGIEIGKMQEQKRIIEIIKTDLKGWLDMITIKDVIKKIGEKKQ